MVPNCFPTDVLRLLITQLNLVWESFFSSAHSSLIQTTTLSGYKKFHDWLSLKFVLLFAFPVSFCWYRSQLKWWLQSPDVLLTVLPARHLIPVWFTLLQWRLASLHLFTVPLSCPVYPSDSPFRRPVHSVLTRRPQTSVRPTTHTSRLGQDSEKKIWSSTVTWFFCKFEFHKFSSCWVWFTHVWVGAVMWVRLWNYVKSHHLKQDMDFRSLLFVHLGTYPKNWAAMIETWLHQNFRCSLGRLAV